MAYDLCSFGSTATISLTNRSMDDLDCAGQLYPQHRRSKNVVPADDLMQRLRHASAAVGRRKREQHRYDVGVSAPLIHQVVKEHPVLERCERIDVLNIGATAGRSVFNVRQVLLIEIHQRQHLRSDLLAALRNPVWRDVDVFAGGSGQRLRQRRQGRTLVDAANACDQTCAPQPLHQLHQ
jgi:hypothetical protein